MWIPAGEYPVGTRGARDNLPLRVGSWTRLYGDGPGRSVLRLADEVNQLLGPGVDLRRTPYSAILVTNRESGLYYWNAVTTAVSPLPPADRRITIGKLTLDGNKDRQSQFYTGGGTPDLWREWPSRAKQFPGTGIDSRKLVKWGSGERSLEVAEKSGNGLKATYHVAATLVSAGGLESTAMQTVAVTTTGPFEVRVQRLAENLAVTAKLPPTLNVYVCKSRGVDQDQFNAKDYVLVKRIPGLVAGKWYGCDATSVIEKRRPPGLLSLEAVQRLNPDGGAAGALSCGIELDNATECLIEDVEIRDFAVGAMYFGSQAGGRLSKTVCRRVDMHGLPWFAVALQHIVEELELVDCTIWDSTYGIDVENVTRVVGLTLRRCQVLECPGSAGIQIVPPAPPNEFRDLSILGCDIVGSSTHVLIGRVGMNYQNGGWVRNLVIDVDPESGRRCTFEYARVAVLVVKGRVTGRLHNSNIRNNGFPYPRPSPMGPLPPMPPYYEASSSDQAGNNRPTIAFAPLPGATKAESLAGPTGWSIEKNTIQANRFDVQPSPVNDWGIVNIGQYLVGFRVTGNTVERSASGKGVVFVRVGEYRAPPAVSPNVVEGNRGSPPDVEVYCDAPPFSRPLR